MALPDELVKEIFLRLPPDEPSSLLRASLTSKTWRLQVSRLEFLRRLYEIYRNPPLLGFFKSTQSVVMCQTCLFIPATAHGVSLVPRSRGRDWSFLDCRHGRVLLYTATERGYQLLVWEPITAYELFLPEPPVNRSSCTSFTAAVVCASDGCDHHDCHMGSFRVVFVSSCEAHMASSTWVHEYSSEIAGWSEGFVVLPVLVVPTRPVMLVGNSLLCFLCTLPGFRGLYCILQYDLAGPSVRKFGPELWNSRSGQVALMLVENVGLGVVRVYYSDATAIFTITQSTIDGSGWVRRELHLDNPDSQSYRINGFVYTEETNIIVVNTCSGILKIELESKQVGKVSEYIDEENTAVLFPFRRFYIPSALPQEEEKGSYTRVEDAIKVEDEA